MSNIINVKEERNILSFEGEVFDIVANSTNFYLKFTLDDEWLNCSIITVVFSLDGEKYYTELDEDKSCKIPPTNASKILFCITAEPDKDSKLSSTILSLNVEASGATCLEGEHIYESTHKNLLGLIENLKNGIGVNAENAKYAEQATIAESSKTQVSLTGDESIAGEKNFSDRIKFNSEPIPSFLEIINPNLILNSNFQINQRSSSATYTRAGTDLYTVDRWMLMNGDGEFAGGVDCELTGSDANGLPTIFCQWLEDRLSGKTVTLSATIDGVRYSGTIQIPNNFSETREDFIHNIHLTEDYSFRLYVQWVTQRVGVQFVVNPGKTIQINNVKLEESEYATKYVDRTTAEDLALCQRYFVKVRMHTYGYYSNATKLKAFVNIPVALRISPKISFTALPKILINGAKAQSENLTFSAVSSNGVLLNVIGSGFVENQVYSVYDGQVLLDGEIY